MRKVLLIATLLAVAAPALAAEKPPQVRKNIAYSTYRAELIKSGFKPVRIVQGGWCTVAKAKGESCERIACATDRDDVCEFLFARVSDSKLFIVSTDGPIKVKHEFQPRAFGIRAMTPHELDLDEIVAILPSGKQVAFYPGPLPVPKELPPSPLCSEVPPGTMPCWVKPPPDYKPVPPPRR